jgi:hypothetical protein
MKYLIIIAILIGCREKPEPEDNWNGFGYAFEKGDTTFVMRFDKGKPWPKTDTIVWEGETTASIDTIGNTIRHRSERSSNKMFSVDTVPQ